MLLSDRGDVYCSAKMTRLVYEWCVVLILCFIYAKASRLLVLNLGYILCALFHVSYGTRIYPPLYMLLFAISSHNLHRSILHFLAAL
jgi:hypothetical protein